MKVLYIAHYFLPNIAAGVTTEEIIRMLLQKGHKVTLISPSTNTAAILSTNLPTNKLKLRPAFTGIPRWFVEQSKLAAMIVATAGYISVFINGLRISKREGPFNVILVQYHPFHLASLTSYLLSLIVNAPLIVKIHDIIPDSPTQKRLEVIYDTIVSKINRISLAHATRILSLSTEVIEILTNIFRLGASKISVLPNSVDLSFFSSTGDVKELRNGLKLNEKKIVLFMANVFEDRGLDILLRALQLIHDESTVLVIVGPCNEKYKRLAEQFRVKDKVIFVGRIDHRLVPTYIHMADVCVGPLISRLLWYGLIPRKVIECMACGRPVIVARSAVPKDLAIDGVSAVLVDSANAVQVASAITSLTSHSSLRMRIGREALRIVSERYSTEKLADRLNGILITSIREKNG